MLLQARILQDHFKDQLGDNLSQENDVNPFWYTGKETPMRDGDFCTKQPWLWADRVAEGRSKGTDRAELESWRAYLTDFFEDHMWDRAV